MISLAQVCLQSAFAFKSVDRNTLLIIFSGEEQENKAQNKVHVPRRGKLVGLLRCSCYTTVCLFLVVRDFLQKTTTMTWTSGHGTAVVL